MSAEVIHMPLPESARECLWCHELKPAEAFATNGPGKRRPECRACRAAWGREGYARAREAGTYVRPPRIGRGERTQAQVREEAQERRKLARDLRRRGWGTTSIAREVGVSPARAYQYVKDMKVRVRRSRPVKSAPAPKLVLVPPAPESAPYAGPTCVCGCPDFAHPTQKACACCSCTEFFEKGL